MKILLFDDFGLTPNADDYCIDNKIGEFANELKSVGHEITFYGQKVATKDKLHLFRLLQNALKVIGLKSRGYKFWNYILL